MAEFGFVKSFRKRIRELGKLTPIALVTAFLPMAGTAVLLIIGYPLGNWLKENWEIGSAGYLAGVLTFCGLSLIPTNLIGVLGGWAFGFWLGLALLMAGIVGASLISFLIHRRLVGDKVPDLAGKHPKAQAIYDALVGHGFRRTALIILFIRLSIIMPFALTNFLMAAAKVPPTSFLTGTFLGMLPRSMAVVLAGAGLSELSLDTPTETWIIIIGIAGTIGSVFVISVLSRRALERLTHEEKH